MGGGIGVGLDVNGEQERERESARRSRAVWEDKTIDRLMVIIILRVTPLALLRALY